MNHYHPIYFLLGISVLLAGCSNQTHDIFSAAGSGNVSELQSYVTADPAAINSLDGHGESPLHIAVKYGKSNCVNKLLELGADPNVQTRNGGDSPLHYAIMFGNPEIVSTLLNQKPNLELPNSDGEKPIDYAHSHQGEKSEEIRALVTNALGGG